MSIDWSKAPEWAACVIKSSERGDEIYWAEPWGTKNGKRCKLGREDRRLNSYDIADTTIKGHAWVLVESRPIIWSGSGLPPVGTVCEWHPSVHGWVTVTILGRDGDCTWYRVRGEEASQTCRHMTFFRAIRTPEQIAAEEKGCAVTDMLCIVSGPDLKGRGVTNQLEALHDAGYRKFKIADSES